MTVKQEKMFDLEKSYTFICDKLNIIEPNTF